MHYSPKQGVRSHGLPHDPFKSSTVPRPIGWISTQSKDGVDNLAPYSQYQNLTWGDPPMVMFAANQSVLADHERKDTVKNAEETGWFVWNMATYDLREAVNLSLKALPPQKMNLNSQGSQRKRVLKHQVIVLKSRRCTLSVNTYNDSYSYRGPRFYRRHCDWTRGSSAY